MYMAVDWRVETLRITVFPTDINSVSVSNIWESVVREEPDEIHFQRNRIDAREVKFGNGRLVLAKQADRIDWHFLSIQDTNPDNMQLPIIGKLEEELNTFSDLANTWFLSPGLPSMHRLAFGVVLLLPVNAVEEGYSTMQRMLPDLNLRDVRDFFYQINRRRMSEVDVGIAINRLSKWNIYSGQLVTIAVNPMQEQQIAKTTDPSIACRLELDINTSAERTEALPSRKLSAIFSELIGLGLEISKRGDVA